MGTSDSREPIIIHRVGNRPDRLILVQYGSAYTVTWESVYRMYEAHAFRWMDVEELVETALWLIGRDLIFTDMALFIKDMVGEEHWALAILSTL